MYPSVSAQWVPINDKLEGHLPFMYLDILGYVTTGMGNLVDPVGSALALPWKNADGSAADASTIQAAWTLVDMQRSDPKGQKQTSGLATKYGGAFKGLTTIHLDEDGIKQVVLRQVAANEATLRKAFPGYDTMPADAQFAVNSMAWAMGAGFVNTFKQFVAAINANDFATAKANADFKGAGVATRIAMNKAMLDNADAVQKAGADHSVLWYPGTYSPGSTPPSSSGGGGLGGAIASGLGAGIGGTLALVGLGVAFLAAVAATVALQTGGLLGSKRGARA